MLFGKNFPRDALSICPEPSNCNGVKCFIDQMCKKKMPLGPLPPTCKVVKSDKSKFISSLLKQPTLCSRVQATELYNKLENCICNPNNDNSGLSGGAIAGIVTGSVVGLALIIFLIWYVHKHNRKYR